MLKRMLRRLVVSMISIVLFVGLCICGKVMAAQYNYGQFTIDCNISGTVKKGSGSTNGAPTGYQNNVLITVYNSNGVSLGNQSSCAEHFYIASASVSNSSGNIRRIYTLHSVAKNYQQVYPYPEQIKLNKYVN